MTGEPTHDWDDDDLWLLRRLDEPRSFGGLTGICPADASQNSRAFYRRRLMRMERHGLVWRAHHIHRNGETRWHRAQDGDQVVAAAATAGD